MALDQAQLDTFHRDGFLAYGPILSFEEVETLREAYDRVIREAQAAGTGRDLTAGADEPAEPGGAEPRKVHQVMNVCERDIAFRKLLYRSEILDVVEDLIGPNLMLFHDQALYKPPHTGGSVPWHQDNGYWQCRPANLVSCWLTFDDVIRESGAMQLIPGSHLVPVHHEQASDTLQEIRGIDASQAEVVELPAGGCMFHHCQTLHYTQPNETERHRRALAIHFMPMGTRSMKTGQRFICDFAHPVLRMAM
jgi:phytanoyl-CoA hydroxylase